MLKLCLFDLDQTLVRTDDLKVIREEGKGRSDQGYVTELARAFGGQEGRLIYSLAALNKIRASYPEMKLGIFTRAPRTYATTVLGLAYPGFRWDVVVAYEDVKKTKPFRNGVWKAMEAFDLEYLEDVALVGDSDSDICAAYHAGVYAVLDRRAWPHKLEQDHWRALGHIPDAVISSDDDLMAFLENPNSFLPELEWLLLPPKNPRPKARFDKVNKFIPKELGGDKTAFPVTTLGRSFAGYKSLEYRRKWAALTDSIKENKAAEEFPQPWITAVAKFLRTEVLAKPSTNFVVTVIPHRPERPARLERFLAQLEEGFVAPKLFTSGHLTFVPDLFRYKNGVKSNSANHLSPQDRFANVRDHLEVARPDLVNENRTYIVIDDVTTTGSTLIYAKKYLALGGAGKVICLALAMNISDVVPKP